MWEERVNRDFSRQWQRPDQNPRRLHRPDLRSADFHRRGEGLLQGGRTGRSLVKCDWSNYKDVLALGGFDITHHLVMYFLKPIEQGLDVKFTGGIHRGCLRVQAAANGKINSVEDLRGKRIGVPGMGTPPFIFANRVLGANGIDPCKEITWLVFPAGELGLALEKGEVDAVADSEPIGTLLVAEGKVKNVADQAKDAPYNDEYCCAVIVNGKFLAANPKAAAAATRALLKAAKWVETNPAAAARLRSRRNISPPTPNSTPWRFRICIIFRAFPARRGRGQIRRGGDEKGRHAQSQH